MIHRTVGAAVVTALLAVPAAAEPLKVAAWNIENLSGNRRTDADFQRLAGYAARLDADVIALQEVNGAEVAAKVFDPVVYDFHFSTRNDTQRTGFAFKRTLTVERHPDVEDLDVGGVRHGTDLTVKAGATSIRFLSVHLKSRCWEDPLNTNNNHCRKLNDQVPVLERWIDDRATEEQPFVVLGDFNRRFDAPGDDFWPEIDDGDPVNASLSRVTEGRISQCWNSEFPLYIDHIVTDRLVSGRIVSGSFEQIVFDAADAQFKSVLSDHCPIAVVLDIAEPPEPDTLKSRILSRIETLAAELSELRALVGEME